MNLIGIICWTVHELKQETTYMMHDSQKKQKLSDSLEGGGLSGSYERVMKRPPREQPSPPSVSSMALLLIVSSAVALFLAAVVYGFMGGWQQRLLRNLYDGPQEVIIQGTNNKQLSTTINSYQCLTMALMNHHLLVGRETD